MDEIKATDRAIVVYGRRSDPAKSGVEQQNVSFKPTAVSPLPMNNTANAIVSVVQKELEDPLAYLPCSTIAEYRKGQAIQDQASPSNRLFLVLDGKVKVCRVAENGRQVILDIYRPDEFFGESAFISFLAPQSVEVAVALENTRVMTWTSDETEAIAIRCPQLAIAFMQLLAQRSLEFASRIESFATDNIARRLARALIRFSERLGHQAEDGSVQSMAFTHELLSQYVGTSREIITHYMNQFRKQGYLRYSRRGVAVYPDAMKAWLRHASEDKVVSRPEKLSGSAGESPEESGIPDQSAQDRGLAAASAMTANYAGY